MQPIFLKPVLKQTIWGGHFLAAEYGLDIPGTDIAEAWMVSGHPVGDCTVKDGQWQGWKCSELWQQHPELFGKSAGTDRGQFPLLIKLIDAASPLSVQVHPDDAYAAAHEKLTDGTPCLGKSECWTVLQALPGSTLVFGHTAKDRQQAEEMIRQGQWERFLCKVPVHPGDFFRIDPGTVHAIGGGIQILEVQQSSDITYRLYDYDRLQNGKPRPLHLQQSLDVMTVPFIPRSENPKRLPVSVKRGTATLELMEKCDYFSVQRLQLQGSVTLPAAERFCAAVVLQGHGMLGESPLHKGDALLIPCCKAPLTVSGELQLVLSFPK